MRTASWDFSVDTMSIIRELGLLYDSSLMAGLNLGTAIIMGAIVTVGALALAINLLSGFTLKGEPA